MVTNVYLIFTYKIHLMQLNTKSAEVLNNLIQLNSNRVFGYQNVARQINAVDAPLKDIFTTVAGDSAYCISQLFPYIIEAGMQPAVEKPNEDLFQGLKNNLLTSSHNQKSAQLLKADDFDQDGILDAYHHALNNTQFPAELYNIINEQTQTLKKTRSTIINYCAS